MKIRPRNTFIFASGIVLIAGVVFWFNTARLRTADQPQAPKLPADDTTAKEMQQAERRLAAAERMRIDAEAALEKLGPAASDVKKVSAPVMSQSAMIADQPALQVLELKRQRAAMFQEYGDFFRERGLSREQIEKFMEIEMGYIERTMDLRDIERTKDDAGKLTVATLLRDAKRDYEAARAQVLGEQREREFRIYSETTAPLQNFFVRGLAGAAALEGIPLTVEQGDGLLKAALEAVPVDGSGASIGAKLQRLDWALFEREARQILSPAQFKFFSEQTPPSGFQSRTSMELQAAIKRAQQAEAATAQTGKANNR